MCIALPMKVTAVNGTTVHCERTGRAETADASMVEGLIPGDFVFSATKSSAALMRPKPIRSKRPLHAWKLR